MSAKTPTKHGGDWNGKPPAWSRKAFAQGNRAAVKHGVYVEKFNKAERAEIEELADSLRTAVSRSSTASVRADHPDGGGSDLALAPSLCLPQRPAFGLARRHMTRAPGSSPTP